MGKAIRESSFGKRMGKSSKLGVLVVNREKKLFFSVYVDGIMMAGKKQTLDPMWKILMKDADLGEPTSFLATRMQNKQRSCGQLQGFVGIQDVSWRKRKMLYSEKSEANISSWSYDMEGHAKKCVERYCELANRTTQQLRKVATPCVDDH